jgi:hypothetical protein
MKNLVALFVLSATFTAAMAQNKSKSTAISYTKVTPGKGVGELVLGISTEKAIELLGVPEKSNNYEQEQEQEVVKFGKNVSQELCYNTHYDRVFKYKNDCEANIEYPVYKLYFRNNHLVYIVLTSYGYDDALYSKFTAGNNIGFHSSGQKIKSAMGHPEIIQEKYVGEYLYLQNGIDFLTENNEMRAMFIYDPLENEVAQAIKQQSGY